MVPHEWLKYAYQWKKFIRMTIGLYEILELPWLFCLVSKLDNIEKN